MKKEEKTILNLACFPWKSSKLMVTLYMLLHVITGLVTPYTIVLRENLINQLILFRNTDVVFPNIIKYFTLLMLVYFIAKFATPISNLIESRIINVLKYNIVSIISKKRATLLFEYYDNKDSYDLIERVSTEPEKNIWAFNSNILKIFSDIISIIGILFIISKAGLGIALILAFLMIPIFYQAIRAGMIFYNTWSKLAPIRRKAQYLQSILFNKDYAQEKLLFNYSHYIKEMWEKDFYIIRSTSIKEELKGSTKTLLSSAFINFYMFIIILLLLPKLLDGSITIGFYITIITMLPVFYNTVTGRIANNLNKILKSYNFIKDLKTFFDMKDNESIFKQAEKTVEFETIKFDNVSFKYPGSEKYVLRNLTFELKRGYHYSFVGENGSGKSSIVKLLIRLYDADEGRILIDGKNIKDIPLDEIHGLFSVMFQDYAKYYLNVAESIGLGDIENVDDLHKIKTSAEKMEVNEFIEALPNGYKTLLGKVYENGHELSEGQWQKMSFARTQMSNALVKILDEPTAALDPITENELYSNFANIMANKTSIFISHRLGSTALADRIFLLDNKCIAEEGTHDELMEKKGIYYQMFTTQSDLFNMDDTQSHELVDIKLYNSIT